MIKRPMMVWKRADGMLFSALNKRVTLCIMEINNTWRIYIVRENQPSRSIGKPLFSQEVARVRAEFVAGLIDCIEQAKIKSQYEIEDGPDPLG